MAIFKNIYDEYGESVYKFLLSLTTDIYLAEELTQETFYQAFLHINSFENRCSVYTWLCQIGKNAWLKECKRKNRYDINNIDEHVIVSSGDSIETKMVKDEKIKNLRKNILKLQDPYRDVFIMKIYGELKLKEIADLYGKSDSWARVTFYRAKKIIMENMKEYK